MAPIILLAEFGLGVVADGKIRTRQAGLAANGELVGVGNSAIAEVQGKLGNSIFSPQRTPIDAFNDIESVVANLPDADWDNSAQRLQGPGYVVTRPEFRPTLENYTLTKQSRDSAAYFDPETAALTPLAVKTIDVPAEIAISLLPFAGDDLFRAGRAVSRSRATPIGFPEVELAADSLENLPRISRFGELRAQVQSLKEIGLNTKADRRLFFEGRQVVFERLNGELGSMDGVVQFDLDQNRIRSIVFSMNARTADGRLMSLGDIPTGNETGVALMLNHRTLSLNVARAFGARQIELGGAAVLNPKVKGKLLRLGFEERRVFTELFQEEARYWGRDFDVR